MKNQYMGRLAPAFGGEQLTEVPFDFFGVFGPRPTEPPGNPADMGIHNHSRETEGITENHIGRLAPDTR